MSALTRISDWFNSFCDGDFEHQNGIKLDTLDNPGWSLEIDLPVNAPEMKVDGDGFEWGISAGQIIGFADMEAVDALLESVAAFVETIHEP